MSDLDTNENKKNIFQSAMNLFAISFNFIFHDDSSELFSNEFKSILNNDDDEKAYTDAISKGNPQSEISLHDGKTLIITK